MKKNINRRQFLKRTTGIATSAISFPYFVPSFALGKAGTVAPSNRITLGFIGVGSKGNYHVKNFIGSKDVQIAAICDVKARTRDRVKNFIDSKYGNKDCATYKDFRDICARRDIDAMVVTTPDHWHVLTTIETVKNGKDVYMEKPINRNMSQNKALVQAIHRYSAVFQFGTQSRSNANCRRCCELVRNGRIGELKEINIYVQGSQPAGFKELAPVPPGVDYNMWLGPCPYVPHTKDRTINYVWRCISDYRLGWIQGWGVHMWDVGRWGAGDKLDGIVEVEGNGLFTDEGSRDTAISWDIKYQFESGIKVNYVSSPIPEKWAKRYPKVNKAHGITFEGTKGWAHVDWVTGLTTYPENLARTVIGPNEIHLYESNDHARNFLECIKSRKKTVSPVDVAIRSDGITHPADVCIRLKRKVKWDTNNQCFINDNEANRMLDRGMRSPWSI